MSAFKPSEKHAISLPLGNCTYGIMDYIKAVSSVIGSNQIHSYVKDDDHVKIYLTDEKYVHAIVNKNITIGGKLFSTVERSYPVGSKVLLKNVDPIIPNHVLETYLSPYGTIVSQFIPVRMSNVEPEFSHIASDQRTVYMNIRNGCKFPLWLSVMYENKRYHVVVVVQNKSVPPPIESTFTSSNVVDDNSLLGTSGLGKDRQVISSKRKELSLVDKPAKKISIERPSLHGGDHTDIINLEATRSSSEPSRAYADEMPSLTLESEDARPMIISIHEVPSLTYEGEDVSNQSLASHQNELESSKKIVIEISNSPLYVRGHIAREISEVIRSFPEPRSSADELPPLPCEAEGVMPVAIPLELVDLLPKKISNPSSHVQGRIAREISEVTSSSPEPSRASADELLSLPYEAEESIMPVIVSIQSLREYQNDVAI